MISDDEQKLRTDYQKGRICVGVLNNTTKQDLFFLPYVVESTADLADWYLDQVMSRFLKMPWHLGETKRLLIREFTCDDVKWMPTFDTDRESDQIFTDQEKLRAYIDHQYQLYGYGIWAIILKSSGQIIGKAGLSPLDQKAGIQLGYQIFPQYQNNGFGKEASSKIIMLAKEIFCLKEIYASIDSFNKPSVRLAESLGFKKLDQIENGSDPVRYLYVLNC